MIKPTSKRPAGCLFLATALWMVHAPSWAADFAHDVVPILREHCVACHGGDEAKGGFSLNTRALVLDAQAVVPGKAAQSRLIELVTSTQPDEQMPPKEKPRLAAEQVSVLRAWINEGLRWEDGFSFDHLRYEPPLRPRRPVLPSPVDNQKKNPVDQIVAAYFAEHQVMAPPRLDDAAFLRRLSLDLVGLPPTPKQLAEFTADSHPQKRRRLIDEVLSQNQSYAEHWMTFWNDLLRNAYSGTGYIDGGRKQITGWLYQALLENKPYDQFVRQLISPTEESEGFIRGIKWRGNVNASQSREVQFAQNITQVLLGINMKCASCHDSFIDRWTLAEAYSLAAIYSTEPLEIYRCDKPTGQLAQPAWIFPELGQVNPTANRDERLRQLAKLMTHPDNGRLTRSIVNRLWSRLMGRGIVQPVDAMQTTEPFSSDLLDYLAVHLSDHNYDIKQLLALIVGSRAYQSQAVVASEAAASSDFVFSGPIVKRMTAEQLLDSIWATTGTWPAPDRRAFKADGRHQGGQLAAVMRVHDPNASQDHWKRRPIRAVFAPLDSLQASLGRPNREQVVTTRPDLLTTLEAIHLTNGQILAETLERGAANLLKDRSWKDETIDWLYAYVVSRQPTTSERAIAQQLVGAPPTQHGVEDLLWTLFMLPEFQYIH